MTGAGCKRAACVWHRKFGKSAARVNLLIREAYLHPGLYWHVFPTYAQGKKTVWDGMTREGRKFLDYIRPNSSCGSPENEMAVWFRRRSSQVVQSFRSSVPTTSTRYVARILSPSCSTSTARWNPIAWDVIAPVIVNNDGWASSFHTQG